MKRIHYQNLLFISIILLLTNCTLHRLGQEKYRHHFLNAESVKVAHFQEKLDTLYNDSRIKPIDKGDNPAKKTWYMEESSFVTPPPSDPSTLALIEGIISVASDAIDSDIHGLLSEEKCCDLSNDPDCTMCTCYLVNQDLKKVFSTERINSMTFSDLDDSNIEFLSLNTSTWDYIDDKFIYYINLDTLIRNNQYLLTVDFVNNNNQIRDFSAKVTID